MKKITAFTVVAILAIAALVLTACGKSEFGVTENTGKSMTLTAENSGKDDFVASGTLDVAEGEKIVITSGLSKGQIRIELIPVPEDADIDQIPESEGEAVFTADIGTEGTEGTVDAGSYMVKATCLEKSTGTVQIEAK